MVKENEKPSRLDQELSFVPDKRAIVFVNTKRQCDSVFNQLESQGHRWAVWVGGWVGVEERRE
jgi:ATP-dependent RNA helicase DDX23/PRP28